MEIAHTNCKLKEKKREQFRENIYYDWMMMYLLFLSASWACARSHKIFSISQNMWVFKNRNFAHLRCCRSLWRKNFHNYSEKCQVRANDATQMFYYVGGKYYFSFSKHAKELIKHQLTFCFNVLLIIYNNVNSKGFLNFQNLHKF